MTVFSTVHFPIKYLNNKFSDPDPYRKIPKTSVGDPDPLEPHVFGHPGSESIGQMYGSGSGSFPFLIKFERTEIIYPSLKLLKKGVGSGVGAGAGSRAESGSGSVSQRYGSADPDPHQNVTDPQYCQ